MIKKVHTFQEMMMYLEALEMLDMAYALQRVSDGWIIEYEMNDSPREEPHIKYEN